MDFSSRILNRLLQIKDGYLMINWIAERQSRYSAPDGFHYWLPHVTNSKDCLFALFLSQYLPYWETEEIYKRIAALAYQHRYQGQWDDVQAMLELIEPTREPDEGLWLTLLSPDSFFGNFLSGLVLFLKRNRKVYKNYDSDVRVPRKKQFRRGYQDKGTLRPSHQKHRQFGDPDPGLDKRHKVNHPMLKTSWTSTGDSALPSTLKGGAE